MNAFFCFLGILLAYCPSVDVRDTRVIVIKAQELDAKSFQDLGWLVDVPYTYPAEPHDCRLRPMYSANDKGTHGFTAWCPSMSAVPGFPMFKAETILIKRFSTATLPAEDIVLGKTP